MKAATGSKPINLEDSVLIDLALRENSQAAFDALYTRYHASVRAHISRYVQDPQEIEDICMESFEKAFKQLGTYRSENRFSTWIFRIARNTAYDHRSRERARGQNLENGLSPYTSLEQLDVPADNISPEEEIIHLQDHERFLACIEGLPELYREIARLNLIDNLGYQEIADKTALPLGTVRTRIRRAKAQIERMMNDEDDQ